MGMGDWGVGFGDWGLGPIPNPQSPIPNPQSPILLILLNIKIFLNFILNKYPTKKKSKKIKNLKI